MQTWLSAAAAAQLRNSLSCWGLRPLTGSLSAPLLELPQPHLGEGADERGQLPPPVFQDLAGRRDGRDRAAAAPRRLLVHVREALEQRPQLAPALLRVRQHDRREG